jgi:hypothetical protein
MQAPGSLCGRRQARHMKNPSPASVKEQRRLCATHKTTQKQNALKTLNLFHPSTHSMCLRLLQRHNAVAAEGGNRARSAENSERFGLFMQGLWASPEGAAVERGGICMRDKNEEAPRQKTYK